MKLILAMLVLGLVVEAQAQRYRFSGQAIRGGNDMFRTYRDMRKANWKDSDKYFHARGNYDAARRGPGGSDGREALQGLSRHGNSDSAADREANRWGRNGGDPNHYRPRGLPKHY
ncbi:serum amyloid A isoform X2 [Chanodichthys erythropterus]